MQTWQDLVIKLIPIGWMVITFIVTFIITSIFDYIKWHRHYKLYGDKLIKNEIEEVKKYNKTLLEVINSKERKIKSQNAKLKAVSESLRFYLHEQETHLNGIKGALEL